MPAAARTETAKPSAGEPEPVRVGGADGGEGLGDARAEDLGRRDGYEQGEQGQAGCGDAAASRPGVNLGEHGVHVLGLLFGRRTTNLEVGRCAESRVRSCHEWRNRRRPPPDRRGGSKGTAGGRLGRGRVHRGRIRIVGLRKPADRPGRGRVHARARGGDGADGRARFLRGRAAGGRVGRSCSSWRSISTAIRSSSSGPVPRRWRFRGRRWAFRRRMRGGGGCRGRSSWRRLLRSRATASS